MCIANTPTLETERLILRKFTPNDIQALLDIHCDEEVNRFLPWFPIKTFRQAEEFYKQRYEPVYQQEQGYMYAVCFKEDNVPVGYINISMNESHDLGYGLVKKYWHKGIISEAAFALVEQVKKDGLKYITATHDVNNPNSGGVMKKIGMKYKYSYEELVQPKNELVTFRMYQMNFDEKDDSTYMKYWNISQVHFVEEN